MNKYEMYRSAMENGEYDVSTGGQLVDNGMPVRYYWNFDYEIMWVEVDCPWDNEDINKNDLEDILKEAEKYCENFGIKTDICSVGYANQILKREHMYDSSFCCFCEDEKGNIWG